jgi:hypothetical protein
MATPTKKTRSRTTVDELLARAQQAHAAVQAEPAASLDRALDAGDALNAAKAQLARGEWGPRLAATGIPSSSARLYMQLARARDQIVAAGCTSIRQARQLLADVKPRQPRRSRASGARGVQDRYAEGYADGYRKGRADGYAAAKVSKRASNGARSLPAEADLKWLIKLAHPDKHRDRDELKATRTTQWLTGQLAQSRTDQESASH